MVCPNCGNKVAEGNVFCMSCGVKLDAFGNAPESFAAEPVNNAGPQTDNLGNDTQPLGGDAQAESADSSDGAQQFGGANVNGPYMNNGANNSYTNYGGAYGYNYGYGYGAPYQPPVDIYDHTAEFDAEDINENKLFAAITYLFGLFGIIVALLAAKDSKFVKFHIKQSLKLMIAETLVILIGAVLCMTVIVPIASIIVAVVLAVAEFIAFFSSLSGKAKEAIIVRKLGFLK